MFYSISQHHALIFLSFGTCVEGRVRSKKYLLLVPRTIALNLAASKDPLHRPKRKQPKRLIAAIMGRFRDLFRRSPKSFTTIPNSQTDQMKGEDINTNDGAVIAAMPVAGMQRSNQGTYITSYTSTHSGAPLSQQETSSSTMSSTSRTAVDPKFVSRHGESQWQGKPNGDRKSVV